MAFECEDTFVLNFTNELIDAEINLSSVTVDRHGESDNYYWRVAYGYVTGNPPATAFVLSSASGLGGFFTPFRPEGTGPEVRSGMLEGSVQRLPGVEGDIEYDGTITIIQA